MTPEFQAALDSFFVGCQRIVEKHHEKMKYKPPAQSWELQILQKRARITHDHAAHCFVDLTTGDVLKPANYATPAKHARGNIFDASNGLGGMTPYGPAYLR